MLCQNWHRLYGLFSCIVMKRKAKTLTESLKYTKTYGGLRALVKASGCRQCKLCEGRKNIVFSRGCYKFPVMFIGEAPGKDEDDAGLPFVGSSGRELDGIVLKGAKLSTNDCIVVNTVLCRPPDNRDPESDESSACFPILARQVELLSPKLVVLLGKPALKSVVEPVARSVCGTMGRFVGKDVTKVVGKGMLRYPFTDVATFVLYHPAYVLYNGANRVEYVKTAKRLRKRLERLGVL